MTAKRSDIYEKRDEILRMLSEAVARIDEKTMAIPEIESHLRNLNGNVSDAMMKAAIAYEKAAAACRDNTTLREETNEGFKQVNSRQWKIVWGILGFAGTVILYLIFEVWLDWI